MEIHACVERLKQQLDKIERLKTPPAYNPSYNLWDRTTKEIILAGIGESAADVFHGASVSRMALSDQQHYNFFLQTLELKKQALMALIAEYESSETPNTLSASTPLTTYTFHPQISAVSLNLFNDAHYAQSIEEAFKRVITEVKTKMVAKGEELYDGGDSLINHAFSCERQTPCIKFNPCETQEERDEQKGIMFLFKGIVAIRNRKAHENVIQRDANKAIEYLCLASLLMRLLDSSS